jgi:hypothetical protein
MTVCVCVCIIMCVVVVVVVVVVCVAALVGPFVAFRFWCVQSSSLLNSKAD